MKYHTIDLNGNEINLRLTSLDATNIEKKANKSILEIISEASMKNTCMLLRYFVRGGGKTNFSEEDSYNLFDELADSGYALETIQTEIILPTLQVSGLLTKSDLENILAKVESSKATQSQK